MKNAIYNIENTILKNAIYNIENTILKNAIKSVKNYRCATSPDRHPA